MKHRLPVVFAIVMLPMLASAQGISTAGIRGRVYGPGEESSSRIEIRNDATGFSTRVTTRRGQFLVEGLEPGGPYSLTVTALGFAPFTRHGIMLRLGETLDVPIQLQTATTSLGAVVISERSLRADAVNLGGGTGMVIDTMMLQRLPTLNRDLYDFVRLVPQISTKITLSNSGLSAGGIGFRFNNFLINGISDRTLSGNVSTTFSGMRSIPLDAVREYQVLLSPYDVRYGDFAGALVNAVTRSGTNETRGSAFVYARNDHFARGDVYPAGYERFQYGVTAGGPILKNRLHYFLAGELQRLTYPAAGAYVGQPENSPDSLRVSESTIEQFNSLMNEHGLTAGSGNRVQNSSPLRNFFGQLNFSFPGGRSRGALWMNISRSNDLSFARLARDTFSLTSTLTTRQTADQLAGFRLNTALLQRGGGSNEFLISHRAERLDPRPRVRQPIVRVSVPSTSGGRILLNSGTPEFAQETSVRSRSVSLKDVLSLPVGAAHTMLVGAELEKFRLTRGGIGNTFGTWNFVSLEDFALGIADRYDVRLDFSSASQPVSGKQYAAFTGDQWTLTDHLTISAGIRADLLALDGRAPYEPRIDSAVGRRTDVGPARRIEVSPRLGLSWRATERQSIRGGAGIFTSRYPMAWIQSALSSYGVGGTLTCTRAGGGLRSPPAFTPDYRSAPQACAGGTTITPDFPGEVDLIDPDLRMMRIARASVAHEMHFASDLSLTNEALWTRSLSDFVFVNLNLNPPLATDRHGRVIYSQIRTNGTVVANPRTPFVEVIDLRNTSRNRSYQLSTRLEKIDRGGSGGSASYTYSRVRDVQTPVRVNTSGRVAWQSASVMSGRHDELRAGISGNDIPHRVVLQGTYARSWSAGRTDLSFYYVGESGRPFTYVSFGRFPGQGDLNGDRAAGNDPLYIPRSSIDTAEILFTGISDSAGADNSPAAQASRIARQASAFEAVIQRSDCMKSQRGKILARNSCREPWSNTTIASGRHALHVFDHSLEIQVDAFNFLNLLNRNWGLRREAVPPLLEHVGQTQGTPEETKPVFFFSESASRWATLPVESAFQLQVAVRYRF